MLAMKDGFAEPVSYGLLQLKAKVCSTSTYHRTFDEHVGYILQILDCLPGDLGCALELHSGHPIWNITHCCVQINNNRRLAIEICDAYEQGGCRTATRHYYHPRGTF